MRLRLAAALALTIQFEPFGLQLPPAYAAPCCGGSSAAPTILTGDDRAQFSASLAQSQIIGDVPAGGSAVYRADGDLEQAQTLRIEGAFLLSDRWQIGASVPYTRRSRSTPDLASASSGFGDLGLSGAYEILPEWEYSLWKPRGFLFVQTLIPTGGSIYESSFDATDPWGLDARGRGFYALGIGGVLLKGWGDWDAALVAEAHRSFARSFSTSDGALDLTPGWGGSASLAGGYSLTRLPVRFGLALSPAYEGSIAAVGSGIDSVSDSQLVWNASAQVGWMFGHDATLSAVYTDQTFFGPATNVSLSRTVALYFQKRWER
jgi:hypothetical protein